MPRSFKLPANDQYLPSNFFMAFSIAGTFLLKTDHCSAVKLIPIDTSQTEALMIINKCMIETKLQKE
ncbi:hypothetical protein HanRHA438_Chr17g0791161 [Helianthus annuus]|nr:hypothetical protein HanRHA438_Chr17g0791161 [Helianthus annuus]